MLALKKKEEKTRPLITQCNRNQKQFSPSLMDWYVLQKLKYSYLQTFITGRYNIIQVIHDVAH